MKLLSLHHFAVVIPTPRFTGTWMTGFVMPPNGRYVWVRKKTTLPETNSSPLKMDGWNTSFLLGRPIFKGYVSFREGIS